METEQQISTFRKTPPVAMVPTADIKASGDDSIFPYKIGSSEEIAKLSKKVIASSYQFIDSISGHPSHLLLNLDDYHFPQLRDILKLLEAKKIIKQYMLGDMRYNDAPSFYRMNIVPNYEKGVTDGTKLDRAIGHGFGKNAKIVFSQAIGEILERYFLTLYRKKDFLRGSPDDLKNKKIPALDLNLLVGFSEEQKKDNPKLRFNGESVFCWEKAKRFSTGETIYLPAQTIYWTYQNDYEPLLGETNTNGAGGWFTEEGAILSGIYEIIQRDSFLIYWLNELTPKTVDPETVPDEDFQSLLAESKRYGFEIYCLNITADTGVPAFAVVISDSSGKGPRFCLGAGCQANPARALHRALEEAWSVYYWIRPLPPFSALDESYQPFKEKRIKQDERLRLWANPEMADRFKFLISGKKESFADIDFNYPKEFASQKEELDFLVKRIEKLGSGYEVYYFLPQHSVLSEIGYYSAQVIIPRFMPLYIFEIDIPLNSPRLKEVPPKLGLKAAKNINPLPHPFP